MDINCIFHKLNFLLMFVYNMMKVCNFLSDIYLNFVIKAAQLYFLIHYLRTCHSAFLNKNSLKVYFEILPHYLWQLLCHILI